MNKETIKNKIRKVFEFLQTKEVGHDEHRNNGYVVLSDKKYYVGKMSYDEWYLEPYYKNRTERDTFTNESLWENSDIATLLQLFEDNNLLELQIK